MSEWENKSLAQFVTFQRGFDLPKSQFISGDIPVFGSTSILGYHNLSKVAAPGVITGRSGTLGKFQYSTVAFWPHNTTLWVKDFKGNDPKFSYYLMQCFDFSNFNGGGAVPTLNRNVLKSLKVDVPPLPTQQKIAKILSNYDDLIENNLKRIKLLEESARLTYEEWFLRFRIDGKKLDIDPATNLPFGWKKNKLVSLCENFTDGTHDSPKQVDGIDSYYLITGKHLASNQIDFSTAYKISESDFLKISKRSGLRRNDILFSNIGTLGHVAMVGKFIEFSCKNVFIFRPLKDVNCYLFEFLKYEQNKNNFIAQSSGSTQKFISLQFMRSFETALAPVTILHEFNKVVSGMYAQIDNLQDQNKLLKEAREILLPRLMTGMIDTDELDIAV